MADGSRPPARAGAAGPAGVRFGVRIFPPGPPPGTALKAGPSKRAAELAQAQAARRTSVEKMEAAKARIEYRRISRMSVAEGAEEEELDPKAKAQLYAFTRGAREKGLSKAEAEAVRTSILESTLVSSKPGPGVLKAKEAFSGIAQPKFDVKKPAAEAKKPPPLPAAAETKKPPPLPAAALASAGTATTTEAKADTPTSSKKGIHSADFKRPPPPSHPLLSEKEKKVEEKVVDIDSGKRPPPPSRPLLGKTASVPVEPEKPAEAEKKESSKPRPPPPSHPLLSQTPKEDKKEEKKDDSALKKPTPGRLAPSALKFDTIISPSPRQSPKSSPKKLVTSVTSATTDKLPVHGIRPGVAATGFHVAASPRPADAPIPRKGLRLSISDPTYHKKAVEEAQAAHKKEAGQPELVELNRPTGPKGKRRPKTIKAFESTKEQEKTIDGILAEVIATKAEPPPVDLDDIPPPDEPPPDVPTETPTLAEPAPVSVKPESSETSSAVKLGFSKFESVGKPFGDKPSSIPADLKKTAFSSSFDKFKGFGDTKLDSSFKAPKTGDRLDASFGKGSKTSEKPLSHSDLEELLSDEDKEASKNLHSGEAWWDLAPEEPDHALLNVPPPPLDEPEDPSAHAVDDLLSHADDIERLLLRGTVAPEKLDIRGINLESILHGEDGSPKASSKAKPQAVSSGKGLDLDAKFKAAAASHFSKVEEVKKSPEPEKPAVTIKGPPPPPAAAFASAGVVPPPVPAAAFAVASSKPPGPTSIGSKVPSSATSFASVHAKVETSKVEVISKVDPSLPKIDHGKEEPKPLSLKPASASESIEGLASPSTTKSLVAAWESGPSKPAPVQGKPKPIAVASPTKSPRSLAIEAADVPPPAEDPEKLIEEAIDVPPPSDPPTPSLLSPNGTSNPGFSSFSAPATPVAEAKGFPLKPTSLDSKAPTFSPPHSPRSVASDDMFADLTFENIIDFLLGNLDDQPEIRIPKFAMFSPTLTREEKDVISLQLAEALCLNVTLNVIDFSECSLDDVFLNDVARRIVKDGSLQQVEVLILRGNSFTETSLNSLLKALEVGFADPDLKDFENLSLDRQCSLVELDISKQKDPLSLETINALERLARKNTKILQLEFDKPIKPAIQKKIDSYIARNVELVRIQGIGEDDGGEALGTEKLIEKVVLNDFTDSDSRTFELIDDWQFPKLPAATIDNFLKALETNTHLTELKLIGLEIDDKFAEKFAKMLEKNESLRKISLDYNRLSSIGIKAICKLVPKKKWTDLSIEYQEQPKPLTLIEERSLVGLIEQSETLRVFKIDMRGGDARKRIDIQLAENSKKAK